MLNDVEKNLIINRFLKKEMHKIIIQLKMIQLDRIQRSQLRSLLKSFFEKLNKYEKLSE